MSNGRSEIFATPFDISHCDKTCTEILFMKLQLNLSFFCDFEFIDGLGPKALDLHENFYELLKTGIHFSRTADGTLLHDVTSMPGTYVQKC
jgi:hypothetical protein